MAVKDSFDIYIPAKSELASSMDTYTNLDLFVFLSA